MGGLAPFPRRPGAVPATPEALQARGYALRPARDEDIPALQQLYADVRAAEMMAVPWPALVKRSFLDSQFQLQHQHYLLHYADAEFLVLEQAGAVQGRYYLQPGAVADLIVDISLLAGHRGRGVGRALIEASQREAAAAGRGMTLHVLKANPDALRLYLRLGFVIRAGGGSDSHHRMDWPAPPVS